MASGTHGLEVAHSYKLKIPLTSIEEQMIHARLATQIMWGDELLNRPGKWVALVEATNTNTFRNLPGISELRGGIGLRIEEAASTEVVGRQNRPGTGSRSGPV